MGGKIQRMANDVAGEEGSGRLSTVSCVQVKEQLERRIRDNRKISTDETVSEMSVSHGRKQYKSNLRLK
jgi:hypothetical protein